MRRLSATDVIGSLRRAGSGDCAKGGGLAKGRGIRAAQSEATRGALIIAATRLFAQKGFHATATTEIVQAAGVTRGALQHYFPRKEDLFRAVFERAGRGLVDATAERVAAEGWNGFTRDVRDFLANVVNLDVQRIAFVDGPAVLGWTEWRKLQIGYGLKMMEAAITDGIAKGLVQPQPPRALAHLILSIVEEAALMVLNARDLAVEPEEVEFAMISLLGSLKPKESKIPGCETGGEV